MPHVVLLAIGALYGMTDELHQMFVPGRQPDIADWIADILGVAIGYGTALTLMGRIRNDEAAKETDQ